MLDAHCRIFIVCAVATRKEPKRRIALVLNDDDEEAIDSLIEQAKASSKPGELPTLSEIIRRALHAQAGIVKRKDHT